MIPHIVFHAPSDSYFPGPGRVGHAALRRRPPESRSRRSSAWRCAHLHRRRRGGDRPRGDGAHPRPSSRRPCARIAGGSRRATRMGPASSRSCTRGRAAATTPPPGTRPSPACRRPRRRAIRRKDTGHVDPAMRPRDVDYRRFIQLVDTYRECGWDAQRQWAQAPFKIADVQMTAILARATADLAGIAAELGFAAAHGELAGMGRRLEAGLSSRWRPTLSRFVSLDLISGEDIAAPTQACFMPLIALTLTPAQRGAVAAEIRRWCDGLALGLPSTAPYSSVLRAEALLARPGLGRRQLAHRGRPESQRPRRPRRRNRGRSPRRDRARRLLRVLRPDERGRPRRRRLFLDRRGLSRHRRPAARLNEVSPATGSCSCSPSAISAAAEVRSRGRS